MHSMVAVRRFESGLFRQQRAVRRARFPCLLLCARPHAPSRAAQNLQGDADRRRVQSESAFGAAAADASAADAAPGKPSLGGVALGALVRDGCSYMRRVLAR